MTRRRLPTFNTQVDGVRRERGRARFLVWTEIIYKREAVARVGLNCSTSHFVRAVVKPLDEHRVQLPHSIVPECALQPLQEYLQTQAGKQAARYIGIVQGRGERGHETWGHFEYGLWHRRGSGSTRDTEGRVGSNDDQGTPRRRSGSLGHER